MEILLTYKGTQSFDTVDAILSTLEPDLSKLEEHLPTRKRIFNIMVECLQNIVHHAAEMADGIQMHNNKPSVVMVTSEAGTYKIKTDNTILNRNIGSVKKTLNVVNTATPEELREYYKQGLENSSLTDKGTAGLGFIDIARKSGHKLNVEFNQINDQYSNFSMTINVTKR